MIKRYRVVVEIDAPDTLYALKFARSRLTAPDAAELLEFIGYVHPDGEVRPCALPPEGFKLWLTLDPGTGRSGATFSSKERWLAVPKAFQAPPSMSSPGEDEFWMTRDYRLLPEETLEWQEDAWRPFERP